MPIDTYQNKVSIDEFHLTVSAHRGHVFVEVDRRRGTGLNWISAQARLIHWDKELSFYVWLSLYISLPYYSVMKISVWSPVFSHFFLPGSSDEEKVFGMSYSHSYFVLCVTSV